MSVISIAPNFISPDLTLAGSFATSTLWFIPHRNIEKAYSNHDN
jgi:hypothetical protein